MTLSDNRPDAVIVGAGIAGSTLAVALARWGFGVTLLEKSAVHVDRVRGERRAMTIRRADRGSASP